MPLAAGDKLDGKELYYQSAIMVAGIKLQGGRVEAEPPRELFRYNGPGQGYLPSPDGQRFLVLVDPTAEQGELRIISNWQSLMR